LNHHRAQLAEAAACLYQDEMRIAGTSLLALPEWLPSEPVPLEQVELLWEPAVQPCTIDGSEPEARAQCPLRTAGHAYDRYTSAIRYLEAPSLFQNRPSYRLVDLVWEPTGSGRLAFGLAAYFDKLDISETLGHEFAAAWLAADHSGVQPPEVRWRDLPFRRLVGDPFDLTSKAAIPAITTLTLIRRSGGNATFLLHWRDPAKVATATGLYDVIPAGEFQPASISPHDNANDFDIWRNIVREYSEELLGMPEHDGTRSQPIDYERWPFYRSLGRARSQGAVRAFCLGVGFDALTLAATIPTVVIIEENIFEEIFGEVVRTNAEGIIITGLDSDKQAGADNATGIAFDADSINHFLSAEPMAPPGAACLTLAWQHRDLLLSV
jgi:hypothetical protein